MVSRDSLLEIVLNSIKKYGGDDRNKFLKTLEDLQGNQRFLNVADKRTLLTYIDFLNTGRIDQFQDPKPLTSSDFWKKAEGEKAWLYTAKILPILQKDRNYEDAYKEIFDGFNILPAGIDDESKKDPLAKTIWNIVEKTYSKIGKNDDDQDDYGSVNKKERRNTSSEDSIKKKLNVNADEVKKLGLNPNDRQQMYNLSKFISTIISK